MDNTSARHRWTGQRQRKEPTLYDEWLNEEKKVVETRGAGPRGQFQAQARRPSNTASTSAPTASTIRTVTPEVDGANPQHRAGSSGFEKAFMAGSFTSVVGGPATAAAMESSTPPTSSSSSTNPSRSWRREKKDNHGWESFKRSPGGGKTGTLVSSGKGMLGRRSSKNNGARAPAPTPASSSAAAAAAAAAAAPPPPHPPPPPSSHNNYSSSEDNYTPASRPRTRTLDDRVTRNVSPMGSVGQKQRQRMGSVNSPPSPVVRGADFLASVPAAFQHPSPPSISSLGSPVQIPLDDPGNRSSSAMSSSAAASTSSSLPSANGKRILHLMRTLNGRMSGNIIFRRGYGSPWTQSYCFIQEETGSLMYEPRGSDGTHRILIPDLRGCQVQLDVEQDTPYVVVRLPHSTQEVHIKLLNQSDFDSWFAVLLCWQPLEPRGHRDHKPHMQPATIASNSSSTTLPRRPSGARSISPHTRVRADSDRSTNRRKSVVMSLKEAPVIKIGKMIFWDTDVTYNSKSVPTVGLPSTGRPQAHRAQSFGSRRWRRISAQLRENGELKLHADIDNSLLSVVQLSQLSRCAIQRLDPSVLGNDFCIAVYPQYTSSATGSISVMRPIFLSLETRVLHEVWFVLLRAFTIPQLYGPQIPEEAENGQVESAAQDLENMLATRTTDMFRMERSLSVRVVEAKLYPSTAGTPIDTGFNQGRTAAQQMRPDQFGYHVEVLLDNETRAKTVVKYEGLTPLWGETFEFVDLPPVLTSASVVIKRRPPDAQRAAHESKLMHEAYGLMNDAHGGYSDVTFDSTCGKVEIYLDELAAASDVEKWWPVVNMYNQRVGEVLIKARAEEGVILMARDYQPLHDLLHRFSNGLTLQIAKVIQGELKRLSDCLLNIYQVSAYAAEWIMALVEDEIDSVHKETPLSRLRYKGRVGSNDSNDHLGSGGPHTDRELMVRDMNKNATVEANLLFRGNTLLTKSLDTHMRRVGKDFLEEALAAKLQDICDKEPNCEVDPNRASEADVQRNWSRLLFITGEVWKSIFESKHKCPLELRRIFRHVRACAEDRYGDFLRSVSYSSVSGFVFLRFFCPAVLNPKIFNLVKDDIRPQARRALTLVAKSLQTLANMASFGTKEHWMEPMNLFLNRHRESFKEFIDDICYVPPPITSGIAPPAHPSPTTRANIVSADTHLSYQTPMTIMQRLPPTSREGFPSLPYLIDQTRSFADLVQLWLGTTAKGPSNEVLLGFKSQPDVLETISQSEGDLKEFHDLCSILHARTQECLSRAERAERPNSALSFRWEELIDQLQSPTEHERHESEDEAPVSPFASVAERIATDPTLAVPKKTKHTRISRMIGSLGPPEVELDELDEAGTRMYESTPNRSESMVALDDMPKFDDNDRNNAISSPEPDRYPSPNLVGSMHPGLPIRSKFPPNRHSPSPTPPPSAGASNVSSAVSSDTEHAVGATALPSYDRELRQREMVDSQSRQQGQRESGKHRLLRDKKEKERRQGKTFVSALRKKRLADTQ